MFQTIAAIMTYSICHVKEMIAPSRPFVEIQLGDRPIKALYDSGADISCISDVEFRRIPVNLRPSRMPEDRPRRYIGAGGHQLDVRGVFTLQMKVLGRQINHPFRVIRGLHEPAILGADFINQQCLGYDPCKRTVVWMGAEEEASSPVRVSATVVIPEFSSRLVHSKTNLGGKPLVVAEIFCQEQPHLQGGPGLVETDQGGRCLLEIFNSGLEPIILERGCVVGQSETLDTQKMNRLDKQVISSIARTKKKEESRPERIRLLKEKLNLQVPEEYEQRYVDLLVKHHAAFSLDKNDIGLCNLVQHKLTMKTPEPVFVKQFKIPEAHQHYLHEQIREWLKLGIIEPSRSKYNSPLFLVQKKDGSYRVVQDFRSLNAHTYVDKYSMKDVAECISDIGKAGSKIFTTLDLTSGFWQMA